MSWPAGLNRSARDFPRARADAPGRAKIRADWAELLMVAETVGALAAGGAELEADLAHELKHRVARHAAQPFPLSHASAADAAAGFRLMARGFGAAGEPAARRALGAAMSAAARCCAALLEQAEQGQAEAFARQTRARLGEREED